MDKLIKIDPDLHRRLKEIREKHGISLKFLVEMSIIYAIKNSEKVLGIKI